MSDVCVVMNFIVTKAATLGKSLLFLPFPFDFMKSSSGFKTLFKKQDTFLTSFDSEIYDDYNRYY